MWLTHALYTIFIWLKYVLYNTFLWLTHIMSWLYVSCLASQNVTILMNFIQIWFVWHLPTSQHDIMTYVAQHSEYRLGLGNSKYLVSTHSLIISIAEITASCLRQYWCVLSSWFPLSQIMHTVDTSRRVLKKMENTNPLPRFMLKSFVFRRINLSKGSPDCLVFLLSKLLILARYASMEIMLSRVMWNHFEVTPKVCLNQSLKMIWMLKLKMELPPLGRSRGGPAIWLHVRRQNILFFY